MIFPKSGSQFLCNFMLSLTFTAKLSIKIEPNLAGMVHRKKKFRFVQMNMILRSRPSIYWSVLSARFSSTSTKLILVLERFMIVSTEFYFAGAVVTMIIW